MANPSKAKGTAAETAVVKYLRANGFPNAERRALAGRLDLGDVLLTSGAIAEVKAHATVTDGLIDDWICETAREGFNAKADIALLIVKRPRKNVGDWWCWHSIPSYGWRCTWLHEAAFWLRYQGWGTPNE